jgi:primosomal protein N' (replication factor Y) (superfamily II helicase)
VSNISPQKKHFICVRPIRRNVELWYTMADTCLIAQGNLVRIPLRNRLEIAQVIKIEQTNPGFNFALREIDAVLQNGIDQNYQRFLDTLSWYYQIKKEYFIAKLRAFFESKEKKQETTTVVADTQRVMLSLTTEQKAIVDAIIPDIIDQKHLVSLIAGVTGSGKTECYKALMHEAILTRKSVILLLPEVSLSQSFEIRLKKEMPELPIFGFHSASSKKEKNAVYDAINQQKPIIIVGVHLPIMLPISNLGLIIIDEEHDPGYQEKNHPKMNTKEIALFRAHIYNIAIVLGSATPSITSFYNTQERGWKLYTLKKRFSGCFPQVQTVLLLEKDKRPSFWITKRLQTEIQKRLDKQEQVLLFLNRRGMCFFVQCTSCSFCFSCSACAVSLTLHEEKQLVCHYCARSIVLPESCPNCKKADSFLKKGIGTQQLVSIIQTLFPTARVARFDRDVSKKKGFVSDLMEKMQRGEIDILIGTQSITRGLHFNRVSLVGIIWADLHMHLPMFNALETTMQQLVQIAGRAGRSNQVSESVVIAQTMTNHEVFSYLSEIEYHKLYTQEITQRKQFLYPPFVRFSEIELRSPDEAILEKEAVEIAEIVSIQITNRTLSVTILGPTKPLISKIEHIHIRKIYLKSANIKEAISLFLCIASKKYVSKRYFIPNVTTL